jgi:ribosomal protein L22
VADEKDTKDAKDVKADAKSQPETNAPRNADGLVEVRASARFVRRAPRKARLVMDHIRGKRVDEARAMLQHTPRAAAVDIAKLLDSAVANAENNFELDPDDLRIHRATVDEGPTIKRFRPRALGRATPIHKRTSHMTITLTTTAAVAGSADTPKARK